MIALLNYVVPIIALIAALLTFKFQSYKPALIGAVLVIVWTVVQPSYLPKGTVPAPVIHEIEYVERPIIDRGKHPMTDAMRDKARNESLRLIDESIETKIKESGK